MTIQVSLEHSITKAILLNEEAKNGSLKTYSIEVKEDFDYPGFAGRPDGQIKAYKAEVDGVEGFLFSNPMDNYVRYDFMPVDKVQPNPVFLGSETPEADRQAQAIAEAKFRAEQAKLAEQKMMEKAIEEQEKEREARVHVNEILPNFFKNKAISEFMKNEGSSMFVPSAGRRIKGRLDRHAAEVGALPVLVVPEGDNNLAKEQALMEQLQMDKLKNQLQGSVDIKINSANEIEFNILDVQGNQCASISTILEQYDEMVEITAKNEEVFDDLITVSRIDLYEGDFKVYGKEVQPGDSLLGKFFEELMETPCYESDDYIESVEIDGIEADPIEDLNSLELMTRISNNEQLKVQFKMLTQEGFGHGLIKTDHDSEKTKTSDSEMTF